MENKFKQKLVKKLEAMFPESIICHLDANEIQGIPDLLILHKNKWAALEGKRDKNASYRPNQEYYIKKMHSMSFCREIDPENEEEILNELQQTL